MSRFLNRQRDQHAEQRHVAGRRHMHHVGVPHMSRDGPEVVRQAGQHRELAGESAPLRRAQGDNIIDAGQTQCHRSCDLPRTMTSVVSSNSDETPAICIGNPPYDHHPPDSSCQHSLNETTQRRTVTTPAPAAAAAGRSCRSRATVAPLSETAPGCDTSCELPATQRMRVTVDHDQPAAFRAPMQHLDRRVAEIRRAC